MSERRRHNPGAFPKFAPARRLRCSGCNKTWKYSDALNHSVCPRCKNGRLS